MSLSGETVVVTGASRGIGQAIARMLAEEEATVLGTATSQTGADNITAGLAEYGTGHRGFVLDVSSDESVGQFFEVLGNDGLIPSVLVNNAGITRDNLLARMSAEEWDTVIQTNLSSVYRMCRAVARPMMKARAGRIINISSVVGVSGNAGQANYAAAKAGMIGFTKALAREIGGRNITVNAIAPGFIETDMTDALPEDKRVQLIDQIPLKRLGTVDDIAAAVCFLAGPGGGYITGSTIHVNGGMQMS